MSSLKSWLNEQRKLPYIITLLGHLFIGWLFVAFIGQFLALFMKGITWSKPEAVEHTPLLGRVLSYTMYIPPNNISWFHLLLMFLLVVSTWTISTRVKEFNKSVPRRALSFLLSWGALVFYIAMYFSVLIYHAGFEDLLSLHDNSKYSDVLNKGSLELIGYVLMLIPQFIAISLFLFLYGKYKEDENLQEWFRTFKFERGWLGRFGDDSINKMPDIQVARKEENNAPVIFTGDTRQLGTLLIGPPGSGKTSMKIIKAFRQDLLHLQRTINQFPAILDKYEPGTRDFKKELGQYLIGSIIIEPAKDLCDSAYKIANDHGIPKEFITYLNPADPETPGINPLIGPTTQIGEMIADVLDSISRTENEFFRQASKTAVKNYVSILKYARGNECDLLDLDRMYQDPRFVMDLVEEVEKTIPSDEELQLATKDEKIHWKLVKSKIRWFRNDALKVEKDRDGKVQLYEKGHEHANKPRIEDLQKEFTRTTRNLLSYLVGNEYLARIFTVERGVNLDTLMSKGGILLCNTDLGKVGATSSAAFGKLVLLCVQNAVFRRDGGSEHEKKPEDLRPLVSLYCDEFYDFMNEDFLQLASQGRKYKIAPLVACQTLTQFGVKFGKDFTQSMLGTIRNLIVYGGVSDYDGELLSRYLGTKVVEDMQHRESTTPATMQSPNYSVMEQTTKEEKEIATADDIMFQEFRYTYIRMVEDKSTKRGFRAIGDFLDFDESEKWAKDLEQDSLEIFMNYWRSEEQIETIEVNDYEVEEEDSSEAESEPVEVSNETSQSSNRFRHKRVSTLERRTRAVEDDPEVAASTEQVEEPSIGTIDKQDETSQSTSRFGRIYAEVAQETIDDKQESASEIPSPQEHHSKDGEFEHSTTSTKEPKESGETVESSSHKQHEESDSPKGKGQSFSALFMNNEQETKHASKNNDVESEQESKSTKSFMNHFTEPTNEVVEDEEIGEVEQYSSSAELNDVDGVVENQAYNDLEDVEVSDDARTMLERIRQKRGK
ncbi:type IV secretory system conjugative DNA transfer family protein [Pontibacillus yanchengensis]|nr:TraM recognition domain-containing protein [Pontibacillus yanchengensis]